MKWAHALGQTLIAGPEMPPSNEDSEANTFRLLSKALLIMNYSLIIGTLHDQH